jgi:hypothetical protein
VYANNNPVTLSDVSGLDPDGDDSGGGGDQSTSVALPWGRNVIDCVWNSCGPSAGPGGGDAGLGGRGGCLYCGNTPSQGVFFSGPLWAQEGQDEARFDSITRNGWDPLLQQRYNTTTYWFHDADGNTISVDWTPRLRQSVKLHFAVRCRSIVRRG